MTNNGGDHSSSSSSSSVVTWSSVTSSTFDPPRNGATTNGVTTVSKKHPLSSISSTSTAGDYYPDGVGKKPATIDNFFRKNNVATTSAISKVTDKKTPTCACTCTCSVKEVDAGERLTSDDCSSVVSSRVNGLSSVDGVYGTATSTTATGSVSTIDAQRHHRYWYWWWSADDGDSDHRRWSSALPGSSPLKPAILDETTLWLRENIETRRVRECCFSNGESNLTSNPIL